MKFAIFRRQKNNQAPKREYRYSFIHYLKWNSTLNMPEQFEDNKKSSKKEIEDLVSNCLDKKRNDIPPFIKDLHKKRGIVCTHNYILVVLVYLISTVLHTTFIMQDVFRV